MTVSEMREVTQALRAHLEFQQQPLLAAKVISLNMNKKESNEPMVHRVRPTLPFSISPWTTILCMSVRLVVAIGIA